MLKRLVACNSARMGPSRPCIYAVVNKSIMREEKRTDENGREKKDEKRMIIPKNKIR